MQVFAPSSDLAELVQVMDDVRLRNQRRESMALLNGGWPNHPVAKLWAPWKGWLVIVTLGYCKEVVRRGWRDNTAERLRAIQVENYHRPPWWGDEAFHSSHRASLLWKDPHHYGQFGWTEHPRYGYIYPDQGEQVERATVDEG